MLDGKPAKPWDIDVRGLNVVHDGGKLYSHDAAVASKGRDTRFTDICVDAADTPLYAVRHKSGRVEFAGDSCVVGSDEEHRLATHDSTRVGWQDVAREGSCPGLDATPPEEPAAEEPAEEPATQYERMGVITAASGMTTTRYRVVTTGPIGLVTEGPTKSETGSDDPWAESEPAEQEDGTWAFTGGAANNGIDAFEFEGEVVEFSHESDDPEALSLAVDGEPWDASEPEPEPEPVAESETPQESESEPVEPTETDVKELAEQIGYTWHDVASGLVVLSRAEDEQ